MSIVSAKDVYFSMDILLIQTVVQNITVSNQFSTGS